MNEELIQRVAEAVWARLTEKPRYFCHGTLPVGDYAFLPVTEPPFDGVMLASLSAAELLRMPDDVVCRALLEGKPVYLREEGLEHKHYPQGSKALITMLQAKERQLFSLGVQPFEKRGGRRLITAQEARRLKGSSLPPGAVLTPLAKDIWEGKA